MPQIGGRDDQEDRQDPGRAEFRRYPQSAGSGGQRESECDDEPDVDRRADAFESGQESEKRIKPSARSEGIPKSGDNQGERDHQRLPASESRYGQRDQEQSSVEVELSDVAGTFVIARERAIEVGEDERRERREIQRRVRAGVRIRGGPKGQTGEFETGQYLDGGDQETDGGRGNEYGHPAEDRAGMYGQNQCEREKRIERRLEMTGEHEESGNQAGADDIRDRAAFDSARCGPEQPRKQPGGLEHSDMGAVLGEESAKSVEDCGNESCARVTQNLSGEQKRSGQRQEGMQREFPLDRARRDAGGEERPMDGIPRSALRIGEERHSREFERRPMWKAGGPNGLLEIFLRGEVDVDGVPLDGRVVVEERGPVKEQDSECQRGPEEAPPWKRARGFNGQFGGRCKVFFLGHLRSGKFRMAGRGPALPL